MVGTISVKETARNSNLPLQPFFAFASAPSHVRITDVPKQLGTWKITSVSVEVTYPDGTSIITPCTLVGGCWSCTFDGCATVGKVQNGATVKADGIDENGNNVNGYVLGKGDVIVLEAGFDVDPDEEQAAFMRLYSSTPDDPKIGAMVDDGGWMVYTSDGWQSIGDTLSDIQLAAIDSVVDERSTVIEYADGTTRTINNVIDNILTPQDIPNSDQVVSLKVGNTVTGLGEYLFYHPVENTNLTTVVLPEGLTSIWANAFGNCVSLANINLPNSLTSIGDEAFAGCSGLTGALTIPANMTTGFSGCTGLTSVTMDNSVTSIGDYAFLSCTGLTNVTIGDNVTSIGRQAFYGCTGLTRLTIPESVMSIGPAAFGATTMEVVVKGKTVDEVQQMSGYPWNASQIVVWNDASQEWVKSYVNECGFATTDALSTKQDKLTYEQNAAINSVVDSRVTKLKYVIGNGIDYRRARIHSVTKADPTQQIIVDWGDGTVNTYNSITGGVEHTYQDVGNYTVTVQNVSVISLSYSYNGNPNRYTLKEVILGEGVIPYEYTPFSRCDVLERVVFKGKTTSEIASMANYPWGVSASLFKGDADVHGDSVKTITTMTQTQYDALATKDASTMYVIIGS